MYDFGKNLYNLLVKHIIVIIKKHSTYSIYKRYRQEFIKLLIRVNALIWSFTLHALTFILLDKFLLSVR